MNDVCAPIKNVSTDGAVSFPSSIPILPNGRPRVGILEQVVPVGRGLLSVRLRDFSFVTGNNPAEVAKRLEEAVLKMLDKI